MLHLINGRKIINFIRGYLSWLHAIKLDVTIAFDFSKIFKANPSIALLFVLELSIVVINTLGDNVRL